MTDKSTLNVTMSGANTTTARTISTTASIEMDNTTTDGKLETRIIILLISRIVFIYKMQSRFNV